MRVRVVLCLVVGLLSAGCAFSRGTLGDELKAEEIASIVKGTTTRAEVIARLGAPDRIVPANDYDIFHYYRYDAKAGSLLLIVLNFSRLTVKSDDLFVLLNRDGVVEDVIFSGRTQGMPFRFWPFSD